MYRIPWFILDYHKVDQRDQNLRQYQIWLAIIIYSMFDNKANIIFDVILKGLTINEISDNFF